MHRLQQFALAAGKVQAGARFALADRALAVAEHDDGHVRAGRRAHRLVDAGPLFGGQRFGQDLDLRPVGARGVHAPGVADLDAIAELGADAFEHGDGVAAGRAVVALRIVVVVGVGADHRDGLQVLAQRQRVAIVLQQHQAFARSLQRDGAMSGRVHQPQRGVGAADVGAVEQAEQELDPQDLAHAPVHHRHRQRAVAQGFAQRQHVLSWRGEVGTDVEPGLGRLARGVLLVGGDRVLVVQVLDRVAVGHHVATEAELVAQALGQPVAAAADRHAVVIVVGAHHAEHAGLAHRRGERRHVHVLDLARGHLRIGAGHEFARALVGAVDDEMLGGGGDGVVLLQPLHHLHAEPRHQIRRLAVDLLHAAPALVAGHVQDRRVDIGIAQRARLQRGDAAHLPHQFAVPGMPDAELCGEAGGAVRLDAADAFVAEVDRDAQPGLFDEEALHLVHRPDMAADVGGVRQHAALVPAVVHLVDVADAVLPQRPLPCPGRQRVFQHAAVAVQRGHLRGLLVGVHLREQVGDARVDGGGAVLVHVLAAVLVEVDPAVAVDPRHRRERRLRHAGRRGRSLRRRRPAGTREQQRRRRDGDARARHQRASCAGTSSTRSTAHSTRW